MHYQEIYFRLPFAKCFSLQVIVKLNGCLNRVTIHYLDIDRMKEQKRSTEKCIADIEKDRSGLEERIEEMRRRRDELDERLRVEQERLLRQERTIRQVCL
ncbi:hypothetical protein OSTOST_10107 [Ostertagia ostertagi]